METAIQTIPKTLLTIDESAYFDVQKVQLKYRNYNWEQHGGTPQMLPVNRYALVRKDNGKLLGIHSNDYIVRPYSDLAEKVNEVILDAVPDI